jgi:hypothetical protein
MQTTFIEQRKIFTSQKEYCIGSYQVHKDDQLEAIERGDGLWSVLINGEPINIAVTPAYINELAGCYLVEA